MSQQSPLLSFLVKTRTSLLFATTPNRSFAPHAFILGNPSADLDSFVSAVLYAYFCSRNSVLPARQPKRLTVPLINLPTVVSNELWRLRPEFRTALELATGFKLRADSSRTEESAVQDNTEAALQDLLITIADTRATEASSQSRALFPPRADRQDEDNKYPLVLVDHNALAIPTIEDLRELPFEIIGCIDHHVDESFVSQTADPRIIQIGIGSCTSLVVNYLRLKGFWAERGNDNVGHQDPSTGEEEAARLALSAILIDTANLTAEGKVSEDDREAVKSLEHYIKGSRRKWDRAEFYATIATAKEASLDHLTLLEIFDRDYKEWTESTKTGQTIRIGISSVVRPLEWLQYKAKNSSSTSSSEGATEMLQALRQFAFERRNGPQLDLFAVMTTSNTESGNFQRELLILTAGGQAASDHALLQFVEDNEKELQLQSWNGSERLNAATVDHVKQHGGDARIWSQRNVAISRKGVAPMLRGCATRIS
ncbi:MAG: hypothetical protein Q9160_003189 [Pyrenula sp. 1 TL-2023]